MPNFLYNVFFLLLIFGTVPFHPRKLIVDNVFMHFLVIVSVRLQIRNEKICNDF